MIVSIKPLTGKGSGNYNIGSGYLALCKPRKGGHDPARSEEVATIIV